MSDKTIIITGGASGLGRVVLDHYLAAGHQVIALDLNVDPLETTQYQDLALLPLRCNITDPQQLTLAFARIKEVFGVADILINNAGIIHNEPLFNFFRQENKRHDIAAWDKVLNVNLTAAFLTTNFFVEQLAMARKTGVIINISSVSSKGTAGQSAYAASKAGLNALTKTWAKELGPLGIRAVSVSPGYIDSDSMHAAVSVGMKKEILSKVSLKKFGEADHILKAIDFAISNDYMTGNILDIDGGLY